MTPLANKKTQARSDLHGLGYLLRIVWLLG